MKKLVRTNCCIGAYQLDLFCKYNTGEYIHDISFPRTYVGKSKKDAYDQAKEAGWKFYTNGTAMCPKCAKEE